MPPRMVSTSISYLVLVVRKREVSVHSSRNMQKKTAIETWERRKINKHHNEITATNVL